MLVAAEAPGAAEVQSAEKARVLVSFTGYTRDGRAYVEFAPAIETRNPACTPVSSITYNCSYEVRTKDTFAHEFGAWLARRARLVRDGDGWRVEGATK